MPAKKKISKKTSPSQKPAPAKKQSDEQIQAEITRALLGIVAISIFMIFVLAR